MLEESGDLPHNDGMKLFLAMFAWIFMAAVLGWGIFAANHGNPWILLVGFASFIFAVGKIGCATH